MKKEKERFEDEKAKEEAGGVADSVLGGLGNLIAGLGGLINGLKKSDAFKERLDSIDEEIDRRLRETPSSIPRGIPPSVARRETRARKRHDSFMAGYGPTDKCEREIPVDIFENRKDMRVIAELPGINEEDIRVDLIEDILTISASRGNRNYYKDVKLPRASESIIGKIYNNGILEVTLN